MSAEFVEFGPPVLFVEDLARSLAFYAETLGFRLGFGDEMSAGLFLGEELFMLTTVDSAKDMLPGEDLSSLRHQRPAGLFNIFVDNTDDAFELLRSRGVEFIVEPMDRPWGRRTAHFKDPDGVIWEISQSID